MRPRLTNEHGTYRSVMCRSLVNNRLLAPLGPWVGPGPALAAGRSPYPRRDIVDAIRYVARTGCQWDALVDFPPAALVKYYFTVWTRDGSLGRIHNTSREQVRQVEAPQPSAALVDSQTVRGAETIGRTSRGYDAGNFPGLRLSRAKRNRPGERVARPGVTTGSPGRPGGCRVGRSAWFLGAWRGAGQCFLFQGSCRRGRRRWWLWCWRVRARA
jgi:transposase